jgi:hypothetical protein
VARILLVRRGLLLAGLVAVTWSATRVVRLLAGDESVVPDSDPHGYATITSLVLLPVLVFAAATLVVDLFRRGHSPHLGPGVALVLSAPLAGGFALVAASLGVAVIAATLIDRRHASAARIAGSD